MDGVGTIGATRPPLWFWVLAVLATAWSAMGCAAYLSQVSMTAADVARLPPGQAAMWAAMPAWATGAYAIAVWGSLAAGALLLLRRRLAVPLYAIALIAVLVQFGWTFLGSGPLVRGLPPGAWMFPAFIIAVQALELWLASAARARGWLR